MRTADLIKTVEFTPGNPFESAQFAAFGQRYADYRAQLTQAGRLETIPPFPLYVMLEQTFRCVLSCPSCIHGYSETAQRYAPREYIMPLPLYERILDEGSAHGLPSVSMHVNDEPLLVPDLEKRVRMAAQAGVMDIIMATNGLLLTEKRAAELLEAGITHILFSMDACTETTYKAVRGGDFNKVLACIETVRRLRGASPFPVLRASFVRSHLNESEEQDFTEFFREKVDYVEVQTFSAFKGLNKGLIPTGARPGNAFRCSMPFTRLIVRPDGDVLPCCSFHAYEISVGNLYTDSLEHIWNGEKMNNLRRQSRNASYEWLACQECVASTLVVGLDEGVAI